MKLKDSTDNNFKRILTDAGIPENEDVSRLELTAFVFSIRNDKQFTLADIDAIEVADLLEGLMTGRELKCGTRSIQDPVLLLILKLVMTKILQEKYDPTNEYHLKKVSSPDIIEGIWIPTSSSYSSRDYLHPYTIEQIRFIKEKMIQRRDEESLKGNALLGYCADQLLKALPSCTKDWTDSKKYCLVCELIPEFKKATSKLWINALDNDMKYNAVRKWLIAYDKRKSKK